MAKEKPSLCITDDHRDTVIRRRLLTHPAARLSAAGPGRKFQRRSDTGKLTYAGSCHPYVFTVSPKIADPAPGPRPAPELACYQQLAGESVGHPASAAAAETKDALGVLAGVLDRDGRQLSASQTWQQALAAADHCPVTDKSARPGALDLRGPLEVARE